MKKYWIILILSSFLINCLSAGQTMEYPSTVAHEGSVINVAPPVAQARVAWNIENQGIVSLWFSDTGNSSTPSDSGPFRLTGEIATNDSIYLHYSVLGNISVNLYSIPPKTCGKTLSSSILSTTRPKASLN